MLEDEQDGGDDGMDELLAVLGYKVKSSDMVDVAHKLEQLDMVMGSAQEDGISHLGDIVHYNPSDLSDPSTESASSVVYFNDKLQIIRNQSHVYNNDLEYDLRAIPGVTAYPQADSGSKTNRKRMKTESASSVVYSNDKQQIIKNQSLIYNDDSKYNLRAILGVAAYAVERE
ncbi:hypothetical protein LWI29_019927 [Acer saccharum]|uniref:Transcriptional factor DELLA N-terminal domain-containing protein n=1 Tax=Acer saccharum TaxID=4024 RepID=A0AA39RZA4_ACESA|nr:hypothetical protein LWI29_019927 [Acer saccharum]